MEPERNRARAVGAVLSSLVSQTAFLLLHLVPCITKPLLSPQSQLPPDPFNFLAVQNLLSSSQIVTAVITACPPRKRRRVVSDSDESKTESDPLPVSSGFPLAAGPDHFPLFFRMSSSTFQYLSGLLEPLLDCCSAPAAPTLPPSARLAIGLFRLATGSPYADLVRRFAVPETAARFYVKRLCRVLCTNFRFWLAFPTSQSELRGISSAFEALHAGLPGCCGAIAPAWFCTSDGGHVIANVVADPKCKILSLTVACQSQKVGPWKTLRSSSLYEDIEEGRLLVSPSYLIGSKFYPLLPWLMVPFTNALSGSKEEEFNVAHDSMLQPALRTISSMRNWGVLNHQVLDENRRMAVACIGTCAILHNLLLMREDYSALSNEVGERLLDVECSELSLEDSALLETDISKEASDARRILAEKVKACYNLNESVDLDN